MILMMIEGFCKILDNIDLLTVLATGSGKTKGKRHWKILQHLKLPAPIAVQ